MRHALSARALWATCILVVVSAVALLGSGVGVAARSATGPRADFSCTAFLPMAVSVFDMAELVVPSAVPSPVPSEPVSRPTHQDGGQAFAVAVAEPYVYLGVGPRLVILDASDPARPHELHRTPVLGGRIERIALVGTMAYVAATSSGVHVLDVSDPASPRRLGHIETDTMSLDIEVSGDYAYVADAWDGLRTFDVSRPGRAYEASRLHASDFTSSVAVSGTLGLAVDTPSGIRVVDLGDPARPREVALLNPRPGDMWGWPGADVAIRGHHAYAVDFADRLWVADLADPTRPELVGSQELPCDGGGEAARLVALDGRLYVLGIGCLSVLDLARPDAPALIAAVEDRTDFAFDLAVAGDRAYVAGARGLRILDLRDGSMGAVLGALELAAAPGTRLAASGGLLYAMPWLLDVSDAYAPVRLPDPFGPYDHVLVAAGDYAYVDPYDRDRQHAIDVYDMSDPRRPRRVTELDTGLYPAELEVAGDVGVLDGAVSGGCPVLATIDLSDPGRPRVLGSMVPTYNVWSMTSGVGFAFLGLSSGRCDALRPEPGWLSIVDLAHPSRPVEVGRAAVPSAPVSMLYFDGHVVLATRQGEIWVFDVGDPSRPVPVMVAPTPGRPEPRGLATDGRYVYVSISDDPYWLSSLPWGDVWVLDLLNLDRPWEAGRLATGSPGALLFHDGNLWSATIGAGLSSWSE